MQLKVLLWNLQDFFIFLDKHKNEDLNDISEAKWQQLSSSLKDQKPIEKVRAIADLIKQHHPHICFFTEVGGFESIDNFNNYFLDLNYQVIHHPTNSDRGIDMAILINKDLNFKHKFHNQKVFARGVLELKLNLANHQLHFLLTHLKSKLNLKGKDFEGRGQRAQELNKIYQIIQNIKSKYAHACCIPLGDLNGVISNDAQDYETNEFAKKSGLKDALEWLERPEIDRYTYVYYNKQNDPIPMQLDYCLLPGELEHCLITDQTTVLDFTGGKFSQVPDKREEFRRMPSDHYPILISFDLD